MDLIGVGSRPSARISCNDPLVHMRGAMTLHILVHKGSGSSPTSENMNVRSVKNGHLVMRPAMIPLCTCVVH